MLNKYTTIYYAATVTEVQMILRNITGVTLAAGCTEIARRQTGRKLQLPSNVLSLARIPDLCTVSKTERYIEFGPSVTLETILHLGTKNIPEVLFEAIQGIANPAVRAVATLGGNIAAKGLRMTTFAPLLALDARLEIKTPLESVWIPLSRYYSNTGKESSGIPEFISKIRIPTESWDISLFRRLGSPRIITNRTAAFVFLVKVQKNILVDIRIAYAGKFFLRKREFENLVIGRSLPLSLKDIPILMEKADLFFDKIFLPPSYERTCVLNFMEEGLRMLL